MSIEKIYDYLPHTKEGRTLVGLILILVGLFSSAALVTIILIPIGIIVLAYDYEWARRMLRGVRDFLSGVRNKQEGASRSKADKR